MSDKRRDQTADREPYGGRELPDTPFGPTVPVYDSPVLPIGRDEEPDDDREPAL